MVQSSVAALSPVDDGILEEAAFAAARNATSRTAFEHFKRSEGVVDEASIEAAAAKFHALPLLHNHNLLSLSLRALAGARGRRVDRTTPFPATLWLGGAKDTYDGRTFSGNIAQFVKLLEERARAFAPKKTGWVLEPTTNTDGWRGNASTIAMHALFLDCDGTGSWDTLLAKLAELDYCYVAYQSGGWTPSTPKWRVVVPLHAQHDTSTNAGQDAWRTIYNNCRCVFGAVARLLNVGFDAATETPCSPWFLTEKREQSDPERQVVWRAGHSLDLTALMIELPEVADEKPVYDDVVSVATALELDEARMNHIIDVLAKATNRVPSGRRDLYLALPGVMLDRGVNPDDVLAIIEAVSASYPRKHPEKHADNMHNARTTISKWTAKEQYTRIGTLNSTAPLVAEALDSVLPDLASKAIVDAMEAMLAPSYTPTVQVGVSASPPSSPATASSPSSPTGTSSSSSRVIRRRGKLSGLGREVAPLASRLKSSKKDVKRLSGLLLGCFVDGIPLPTTPSATAADVNEMVCTAMRSLGRNLPVQTRWQEVLDFASSSLSSMGLTQSIERVAMAERAFYEGQGKRNQSNMKKAAIAVDFKTRSKTLLAAAQEKGR